MTTYALPVSPDSVLPSSMELVQLHNTLQFVSPLNGYTQSMGQPGSRWGWVLGYGEQEYSVRQLLEAHFARLNGNEHRTSVYDMGRPRPRGTINLSGVTASAAAQFATTITLNGCGANTTLEPGDWFSVVTAGGVQLVMCVAPITASGGGVMTGVEFRHMLRSAVTGGAAVVTDKPTALFINANREFTLPRSHGMRAAPVQLVLQEVFA